MTVYQVNLDDGHKLRIEADDQDAALNGAQHFMQDPTIATQPKLTVSPDALSTARRAGYSDDEIANHFAAKHPDQFKTAKDAGYSSTEILNQLSGTRAPDIARIKSNIGKMIDQGAPESDIDDYIASEGVTADQLKANPSGVIAGLKQGLADTVHGVGETAKQFLGVNSSSMEHTAQAVSPKDYHSAPVIPDGGHWYDPSSYNWRNVPQAIAEAAPGMAADVLAAKAAGRINPALGIAAGIGSYFLRTRGDAAKQDAVIRTGDPNATPELQDKARSLATGAVEAVPQAIGLSRFLPGTNKIATVGARGIVDSGKKLLTTGAIEGATGAAQNAVGQAGATVGTDKGLNIDPNQVAAAGVTSAATGSTLASRGLAKDAANAIRFRDFGGENSLPTAAVANRVLAKVNALADLQNPKTAYEATAGVKADVSNELRMAARAAVRARALSPEASNALARATKGNTLSGSDIGAIADATSGMQGGDNILALVQQANVLSKLRGVGNFDTANKRFGGGAGERLRNFVFAHPLVSAAIGGGAAAPGFGGIANLVSDPVSMAKTAALGAGAYVALRGADRFMGLSSPARSFVDKFADASVPVRVQGNTQAPQVSPMLPQGSMPQAVPLQDLSQGPWGPRPPRTSVPQVQAPSLVSTETVSTPSIAPVDAGNAAQQIDPLNLPADMLKRARAIAKAAVMVQKMRDKNAVQETQGTTQEQVPNGMAESTERAVNAIRLRHRLANESGDKAPLQPELPKTSALPNVIRKMNGQSDTSEGNAFAIEEQPVPQGLVYTKISPADHRIAAKATAEFVKAGNVPEVIAQRYHNSAAMRQARIRDRLQAISADIRFPSDNLELMEALDGLRNVRSREELAREIDAIAAERGHLGLSAILKEYFGPKWAASVWNSSPRR